jgi:hypothetical protein
MCDDRALASRFVDPFTPDAPLIDPARFAGRRDQVDSVIDALFQTASGLGQHTVITGDRGIGKSSLLSQGQQLAEGASELLQRLGLTTGLPDSRPFSFATGWHETNPDETLAGLVAALLADFQSTAAKLLKGWTVSFNFKGLIKAERTLGTTGEALTVLVDASVKQLVSARKAATGDGIVLFIDELDRINPSTRAATFFKLVSERLARRAAEAENIAFFAAGITGAIQRLETEHASIFRVFRDIPLPRLSLEETTDILRDGFESVGASFPASIPERVHEKAAGFPEPVHLLGSALLRVALPAGRQEIVEDDFNAALELVVTDIRKNWLDNKLRRAGGGKYQRILEAMASFNGVNVPLRHIEKEIKQSQNQFSANMGTLIDRDVIQRVDVGVYAFCEPLLREYVRRFGVWGVDEDGDGT